MNFFKRKSDEHGIALASVLILVTLFALLASTIVHLSYIAYSRKITEKRNNENFYCAEAVIDTVKSVIQNSVSVAVPDAEYSELDFAKAAFKAITGTSLEKRDLSIGASVSSADSVADYLFEKITRYDDRSLKYDGNELTSGTSTCIAKAITSVDEGGNGGSFSVGDIVLESDGVRIKDVEVVYVNDEGYTANIKTDIVIRAPKYITVSDAPLGSYSMFAGCGAAIYSCAGSEMKATNTILYLHQEGNGYFGSMQNKNSNSSIFIGSNGDSDAGGYGCSILSFDGTNIIFNGNVNITNGGSLIFTGGDGTETAYVQVNGYIVLSEGASLFMAPNVILNCRGIYTKLVYNSDGTINEASSVPYTGSEGAESTVSQFFPLKETAVSAKTDYSSNLQKYYNNEIDMEQFFYNTSALKNGVQDSDLDPRHAKNKDSRKSGVYILDSTQTATGWAAKNGDTYHLLTCSKVASEWTWQNSGTNISNIYCGEDDANLQQEAKVLYGNTYYDKSFFDIVNIPLMALNVPDNGNVNYVFPGYSLEKDNTYTKTTWTDVKTNFENSALYNKITTTGWSELNTLGYLTRDFITPTSASSVVSADWSGFSFVTDEITYGVGAVTLATSNAINVENGKVQFVATAKQSITIHACNGYVAGIFLTPYQVTYAECAATCRVISLIDLGDSLTGTGVVQGLKNDGNPVHDLLEYIGSGYISQQGSPTNPSEPFYNYKQFAMMDNMFNGGMAIFWNMGESSSSQKADNSNQDLVDVDNWNKQ